MGLLSDITNQLNSIGSTFRVKYLVGHPLIDKPRDITLTSNKEGLTLSWTKALSPVKVRIAWTGISKISAETQGEITKRASFGKAARFGAVGAFRGSYWGWNG